MMQKILNSCIMHNYWVCLMIEILLSQAVWGQEEFSYLNYLRAGDIILKEQIAYKDPGRTGQNVLWDVSEQECTNKEYKIIYDSIIGQPDVVAGIEHRSKYYYRQDGDTLFLTRFENSTTKAVFNYQEPLAIFPLTYGSHVEGLFHGYCTSSDRLMMRQFGSYSMKVDATGMLLLPSGDTLHHVKRIHTYRITSEHLYPCIHDEKDLVLWIDSITPFNEDSIRHYLKIDSCLVETHLYRFYAVGYRYPVFETITMGLKGEPPLLKTAYYYSPSSQEDLCDIENERLRINQNFVDEDEKAYDTNPNRDTSRKVSFNYNVHFSGNQMLVEFYTSGSAVVNIGVYTLSGIRITNQNESVDCGIHSLNFDLGSLHSGIYLLSITVNGMEYIEKLNYNE